MENWKWAVNDSDLWDYHVTAVAASSKAQSQSGPNSAPPYGQPGCLMGYQCCPTKPVLKHTKRGRGQDGDNAGSTLWNKRACYSAPG